MKIKEIISKLEDIKCELWVIIEDEKHSPICKKVKDSMNDLLDWAESIESDD